MQENLYTVQKKYEALNGEKVPNTLPNEEDKTRIFKTEYERQIYCAGLTKESIRDAIKWLKKDSSKGVEKHDIMLKVLEEKLANLSKIQEDTRRELVDYTFVIKKLIPQGDTTPDAVIVPPAQAKQEAVATTAKVEIQPIAPITSPEVIKNELHVNEKDEILTKDGKLFTGHIDMDHPLKMAFGTYYGDVKKGEFDGEGVFKTNAGGVIHAGTWNKNGLTGTIQYPNGNFDIMISGKPANPQKPTGAKEKSKDVTKKGKKVAKVPETVAEEDYSSEQRAVTEILAEVHGAKKNDIFIDDSGKNFFKGAPSNPEYAQLTKKSGFTQIWGKETNGVRPIYFLKNGVMQASFKIDRNNTPSDLKGGISEEVAKLITFIPPIGDIVKKK